MFPIAVIVLVLHLSHCFAYPFTIHTSIEDGDVPELFDTDDADAWNAFESGKHDPLISPSAPSPFQLVDDAHSFVVRDSPFRDSPLHDSPFRDSPLREYGIGLGPVISGSGIGNVWEKATANIPDIHGGVGPVLSGSGLRSTWIKNGMGERFS